KSWNDIQAWWSEFFICECLNFWALAAPLEHYVPRRARRCYVTPRTLSGAAFAKRECRQLRLQHPDTLFTQATRHGHPCCRAAPTIPCITTTTRKATP